ncbi:MAG: ferredoxin--NADP(+) reductase [Lysobacterales bacterium 69-70]|nr:ferredoxin--NADP reductase [Xanthomonadaceae bacterium]ODU31097.1 MAG: ferredoxin--NADP(+) reductase [Xanthomonadaceae bacterium SCN 69-320]ODV20739.1 MAG: ferredoxin--NADP(+) reductase [Xanthomonadaceae bacterium SCN 69-25]OJY98686.1 MAG: ferredoxin--NADP(+) reductase [Xanthomonadales bacterium 69-70]
MAEQFPLRLVSSYMLAPAVRHLVFERADDQPFVFAPGQFIQVHFHYADGKPTKRSYSVATVGDGTATPAERIEIAVSYVEGGAATALLAGLQPGDTISASGPYGRFCLFDTDTNRRYLLVGTGTGITPYRAMLPQLRRVIAGRGCTVDLVFGARNEGELLYDADFSTFEREVPGFRYHACLSRAPRAQPRAHDYHGRVQVALEALQPAADSDIAYLCGNPNMVDEAFTLLKNVGLAVPHIRREKYVSSK